MPDDNVTRAELSAHITPMKEGIARIDEAVKDIPAIKTQVERTNGEVAEHAKQIGALNKWKERGIGAGWLVFSVITVFGVYIAQEVL